MANFISCIFYIVICMVKDIINLIRFGVIFSPNVERVILDLLALVHAQLAVAQSKLEGAPPSFSLNAPVNHMSLHNGLFS